jgi:hypothetical protein
LVPIRVEVDAPGYLPWADTVTPAVGETWRLEVALERLPPPPKATAPVRHEKPRPPVPSKGLAVGHGELVITTTPYWGRVTIDGNTEDDTTPVRVRLPAGRHRVEVSHPPLGLSQHFQVTIRPGKSERRVVDFGPKQ